MIPVFIKRLIKYTATGCVSLTADFFILAFLTEIVHLYYLISVICSFTLSNLISYIVNRQWGFKDTKSHAYGAYLRFLFFSMAGLIMTVFLMWVFVEKLGVYYLISRIIVSGIAGIVTFILHSLFTFKVPINRYIKAGK